MDLPNDMYWARSIVNRSGYYTEYDPGPCNKFLISNLQEGMSIVIKGEGSEMQNDNHSTVINLY